MNKRAVGCEPNVCKWCGTAVYSSTTRFYGGNAYHPNCFDLIRSPFRNDTFWLNNIGAVQRRVKRSLGLDK